MAVERVYWDSDAFLGWFQAEPEKMNLCKGTIERAESGEVVIVTSALTIAEVLWLRNAPKLSKNKSDILKRFFRKSYIRVHNVTRSVSEAAQELVWDNGIRPKDAIHVATALAVKCVIMETFDDGLLAQSGRVGAPPLSIRRPLPPRAPKLL